MHRNEQQGRPFDAASIWITSAFFSDLVQQTDPEELGRMLAEQVRELTSAQTVCLFLHSQPGGHFNPLHVCPPRNAALFSGERFLELCPGETPDPLPLYVADVPHSHPLAEELRNEGVESLLRFPLLLGEERCATLILLNLPDPARASEIEEMMAFVGPIIALSIQNCLARQTVRRQNEMRQKQVRTNTIEFEETNRHLKDSRRATLNMMEDMLVSQQRLQQSEEHLRATLQSIGDAVMVTDVDGCVTLINPVCAELTGWTIEEAVGQPLETVFRIINEQTRQPVESPVRKVMETGQIFGLANHTLLLAKDGREIPISNSGAPIKNEAGQIVGAVLVSRDQTKHRTARIALEESEARLKRAQAVAQVGDWEFDLAHKKVNTSDMVRRIYGIEDASPDIEDVLSISLPEYRAMLDEAMKDLVEQGIPYDVEFRVRRPSDDALVDIHSVAEYDPDRHVIFGVIQDITKRKAAETEVQAARKQLQYIIDRTHDVIFQLDLKGNYTYVNSSAESMSGYTAEEILSMNMMRLIAPEYRQAVSIRLEKRLDKNLEEGCFSFEIIRKDGRRIWVEINTSPILNESGEMTGIQGVARDITERKRQDDALQASEEMMRSSQSVAHICSYSTNLNRDEIEKSQWVCSPEFYQIFGMDETYPHTIAGWAEFIHPDWRDEVAAYHESVVKERKLFNKEYKIIRIDDGAERWVHGTGELEFDEDGNPIRMHGAIQDITDRKRDETELRRLSTAIEQSVETILITDTKGVIQYANSAFEAVSGHRIDEALGQKPSMLKSGIHDDAFYANIWKTITSGQTWEGRIINAHKNGTHYTEEATISPVRDSEGRITNYVAVKRDISDELTREDALRQAQKMEAVGQLAGGIAHDFNNILQTITGFCEILSMGLDRCIAGQPANFEAFRADSEEILKAARHAAELTRQLLTFSRKQQTDLREINLNTVLVDDMRMLSKAVTDYVQLECELAPELPPIYADSAQMMQIMLNLVVNARDAMPEGGVVTIATEAIRIGPDDVHRIAHSRPGEFICLSVSDTGTGMDAKQLERIFEPFFTSKEVDKGSGLGLAVVYGIVKNHRGWINVSSVPGSGTTFRIYLPVLGGDKDTQDDLPEGDGQAGQHILLVDDDPVVQSLTGEILQSIGYEVSCVGSVQEAAELFARKGGAFDLLFSDVLLPDGNGIELAEALRHQSQGLPVLLFSGGSDGQVNKALIDQKGFAFIKKPFSLNNILEAVRKTIPGP